MNGSTLHKLKKKHTAIVEDAEVLDRKVSKPDHRVMSNRPGSRGTARYVPSTDPITGKRAHPQKGKVDPIKERPEPRNERPAARNEKLDPRQDDPFQPDFDPGTPTSKHPIPKKKMKLASEEEIPAKTKSSSRALAQGGKKTAAQVKAVGGVKGVHDVKRKEVVLTTTTFDGQRKLKKFYKIDAKIKRKIEGDSNTEIVGTVDEQGRAVFTVRANGADSDIMGAYDGLQKELMLGFNEDHEGVSHAGARVERPEVIPAADKVVGAPPSRPGSPAEPDQHRWVHLVTDGLSKEPLAPFWMHWMATSSIKH